MMRNRNSNSNTSEFPSKAIFYSVGTASSLAILIILIKWGFELRSLTKLIVQAGMLVIPLSVLFFHFIFRKAVLADHIDYWTIGIGICTSILTSSQVVSPPLTGTRYALTFILTSAIFLILYYFVISPLFRIGNIPWERIVVCTTLISGLIGMVLIFTDSLYSRMYSDDFCYAINFDELGFPAAGLWFYQNWSGRFFSNFLVMGFADKPHTIIYQIIFTLLSLFFSIYFSSKSHTPKKDWLAYFSFSLFFTLTVSIVTPDFYKSFFWISSSLVLFPLFILIPIYMAGMLRLGLSKGKKCNWLIILAFLLSFFISTTHEIAALGWLALNLSIYAWLVINKKNENSLNNYLFSGILAAVFGLMVMLLSPGIENRAQVQHYPGATPILETLRIALRGSFEFVRNISDSYYAFQGDWRPGWFFIIGVAGIGWIMDFPLSKNWKAAVLTILVTGAMIYVSFIPGAYVYRGTIPLRSQMIPSFYLTLGSFLFGLLLPRPQRQRITNAVLFFVLISVFFGMRATVPQLFETIEPMRRYAAAWDKRDLKFRAFSGLPGQIDVPWDEYEQELNCIQMYYDHIREFNPQEE